MKLKKIVSLALAGIMAVSMLTACGEGASSSQPTQPEKPTTTSYSSVFAAALEGKAAVSGKITMKDDATLTADLNTAIEKLTAATIVDVYGDVRGNYDRIVLNFAKAANYKDLRAIADDMDGLGVDVAFGKGKNMLGDFDEKNKPWEDKTVTILYAVDSTLTAEAAVKEVAEDLNDEIGGLVINNMGATNDTMHYSYTGSVSVATKTLSDNHGMGMHIVAVEITRSAHA